MEARELRIGNIIECSPIGDTYKDRNPYHGKNIFEVVGTFRHSVNLELGFGATQTIDISYTKPIPLTEDWLIKFGFKKSKHWYTIGGISISADLNRLTHEVNGTHVEFYNQFKCPEYVHQLQNLYFALTGEELTISVP